jgi:NADH-quinone oxidoreductase subunit L
MRRMGGLAKYMPVTAVTCWIGALALVGTPFFSGFYSKDAIIEAVGESHRWGASFAYWCVLCGVFVTALYTFRMLFLTFHGPERFREASPPQAAGHEPGEHAEHAGEGGPHESPAVVTLPLVALAIPSVVIGALTVSAVLFGGYFGRSILVLAGNNVLGKIGAEFPGPVRFALQGFFKLPFLFALAGALTAWAFFLRRPAWAQDAARRFHWLYRLLVQKYYFDWFNEAVLAPFARLIGVGLWRGGDEGLIDGAMVNGTARTASGVGGLLRRVQSGYLYSYAFWMVIGLALLLGWFLAHA